MVAIFSSGLTLGGVVNMRNKKYSLEAFKTVGAQDVHFSNPEVKNVNVETLQADLKKVL